MYIFWDTFELAYINKAIVGQNMRLTGDVTVDFADIHETTEEQFSLPLVEGETEITYLPAGKFGFLKPEERHMQYVSGYVEASRVEGVGEEGE